MPIPSPLAGYGAICIALLAGSALAQENGRARVEQLSEAAAGRVLSPPVSTPPANPQVSQLTGETQGPVQGTPRTPVAVRRPVPLPPGAATRNIGMATPPPEAVDRCEEVLAGKAPALEGVDCNAVLEAAAFARRSPEERLLAVEDNLASTDQRQATIGQSIPNAAIVAERLATGNLAGSAAAQAIASQPGAASQQEAPTVISITNPDGSTGTLVVPPSPR